MKKIMIGLLLGALGASSATALSFQEIERTVQEQVSEKTVKATPIPELAPEKKKDLIEKLPLAKKVMEEGEKFCEFNPATLVHEEKTIYQLNPAELGYALLFSVEREMTFNKETRTGEEQAVLSNEEKRAVYYALNKLLPPYYLNQETKPAEGEDYPATKVPAFKEYTQMFPETKDWNWNVFREAAQEAQELVYQGVVAIATKQDNFRHNWLYVLTH